MTRRQPSPLLVLAGAMFLVSGAFHLYAAALPLYFTSLGFDPPAVGLLIGSAAVSELGFAVLAGPAIDRFGARSVLLLGAGAYVVSSIGFAALPVVPVLILARAAQGLGVSSTMPSGNSLVAGLSGGRQMTTAFATVGAASSAAMAVAPPVGLALLQGPGPLALFGTAALLAGSGALVATRIPGSRPSGRRLRLVFRWSWLGPIAIVVAIGVQWGVITAFLPIVAAEKGHNPAILFTTDAVFLLLSRIPAGWVADRYGTRGLALAGLALTVASDGVFLWSQDDPFLAIGGMLSGTGGGLVIPPMLALLTQRSDIDSHGTALAYVNVSFATAILLGSGGGGLLYNALGFSGLLSLATVLCAAGIVAALLDRGPVPSAAELAATPTSLGPVP